MGGSSVGEFFQALASGDVRRIGGRLVPTTTCWQANINRTGTNADGHVLRLLNEVYARLAHVAVSGMTIKPSSRARDLAGAASCYVGEWTMAATYVKDPMTSMSRNPKVTLSVWSSVWFAADGQVMRIEHYISNMDALRRVM